MGDMGLVIGDRGYRNAPLPYALIHIPLKAAERTIWFFWQLFFVLKLKFSVDPWRLSPESPLKGGGIF